MPRGDKSKYTEKQKRQAEHIEEGYEQRGVPEEEAERRAWATVNKMTGGGKKSGSGRGQQINKAPAKKGGQKGGAASAARSFAKRSASAKKAAQTRKRRAAAVEGETPRPACSHNGVQSAARAALKKYRSWNSLALQGHDASPCLSNRCVMSLHANYPPAPSEANLSVYW